MPRRWLRRLAALSAAAASLGDVASSCAATDDDTQPLPTSTHPYILTAAEQLGALGIQAAWYWAHWRRSGDSVLSDRHTLRTRFLTDDDVVFDNDRFNAGAIGHPIAGAVAYQIARGNGFGVAQSFVASVVSSVVWQVFGEWDQPLSTNDLIVTPVAGWVIGEATYRVGRLFAQGEPGPINCLGAWLLSPVATFNGAPVCRFGEGGAPLHLARETWHWLALDLGAAHTDFGGGYSRDEIAFGLASQIRTSRWYREPGAGATTAWPGQWTALFGRWFLDGGSFRGGSFEARSLVIGRYLRHYAARETWAREPDGAGLLVGLGGSFNYDARDLPSGLDRTMSVGFLGPTIELSARRGMLAMRAEMSVQYGFAQVTSLAYANAAPSFAGMTLKTTLQAMGYYYAQALLPSAAIEFQAGDFRVGIDGRAAALWSINADYEYQSAIQNNFALQDSRAFVRGVASFQPAGGPLRLAVELDNDRRESHIPGATVMSDERRVIASLMLVSR